MNDLKKLRDLMREAADIIDEIVDLEQRNPNDYESSKEYESAAGRFMFKMMEMQGLSDAM
jgi:hypothetical protein